MATLHLICGLPCAGKTTLAKRLEQQFSALRLTPDQIHIRLYGQDAEEKEHDTRHDLIEAMLWEVAASTSRQKNLTGLDSQWSSGVGPFERFRHRAVEVDDEI